MGAHAIPAQSKVEQEPLLHSFTLCNALLLLAACACLRWVPSHPPALGPIPPPRSALPHPSHICSPAQATGLPTWELQQVHTYMELPNDTVISASRSHYVPVLPTCPVDAMTPSAMRRCLAGKHLMIVGDSVSRMWYFNLASALEHGKHIGWRPFDHAGGGNESWARYYTATTSRLVHDTCDCSRGSDQSISTDEGDSVPFDFAMEYYRNPARQLELTYVCAWGKEPHVEWHEPRAFGVDCEKSALGLSDFPGCAKTLLCTPGRCGKVHPYHAQRWDAALRELVLRTKPWAIIANSGLWGVQWHEGETLKRLVAVMEWALREGGVRVVAWRTTTAMIEPSPAGYMPGQFDVYFHPLPLRTRREDLVVAEFRKRKWLVIDAGEATQQLADLALFDEVAREHIFLHRDPIHFAEPIFTGLNKLMVAALCGID